MTPNICKVYKTRNISRNIQNKNKYKSFQYLKEILKVGTIMNILNSIEWLVMLENIKKWQRLNTV